mgnify:FL=1
MSSADVISFAINGQVACAFLHGHAARCDNKPFPRIIDQSATDTRNFLIVLNGLY